MGPPDWKVGRWSHFRVYAGWVLVVLLVVCVFVGSVWLSGLSSRRIYAEHDASVQAKVEASGGVRERVGGELLISVEFDGHWFVIHDAGRGSSMIHHPGCGCLEVE